MSGAAAPASTAVPEVASPATRRRQARWTLAIVSVPLFLVTLDNLVVTMALPAIRAGLGASLADLEWTVNAYTLTFAVGLLPGSALGDRFGRRRMFLVGLGGFTAASAAAALSDGVPALVAARAAQGAGAALVLPLTLTLLGDAFPPHRRAVALGIWSGISGLAVALGPLVGGAVVGAGSWQAIFWLHVPLGLACLPLAARHLHESVGPAGRLDAVGLALAGPGLFGLVYAIVRGGAHGWGDGSVRAGLAAAAVFLPLFLRWEARAPAPMLPLDLFANRAFVGVNLAGVAMYFGIFGSIFLLAPFFQAVQGFSPLQAGLRTLPWTVMPLLVSPVAALVMDRVGARALVTAGLALQAVALSWLAVVVTAELSFGALLGPLVLAGAGMALVYPPAAATVLGCVRPDQTGPASGAMNAFRELGGVLGVAVVAGVFAAGGGPGSARDYVDGLRPALTLAAAVLAFGALAALAMLPPAKRR